MKNIKENKGITLLALIITIIVLLILSGISISMLVGDNGIIENSKQAKAATEAGQIDEEVKLATTVLNIEITKNRTAKSSYDATNFINTLTDGTITVEKSLMDILEEELTNSNYTLTPKTGKITVAYSSPTYSKKYDITVTKKLATLGEASKTWEYATENGKTIITDGTTKLNIGDYVDYDPADGATTTTYTSLATTTGWDNNQIFNVSSLAKTSGAAWRVLGVDEQTGQILLVLAESFVGPTEGGLTNTTYGTTYYYLKGQDGYKNGVSELNKICELYGQGKYAASARSITADDVNNLTGFDPTGYEVGQIYEYNNEVTYSRNGTSTINYSGSNGVSGSSTASTFNYYDENTKTWKEFGSTVTGSIKLTSTYYYYCNISNYSGLDDVSKKIILGNPQEGTNYYFTNTGAPMQYWLGSSYAVTASSCASFGLRYVLFGGLNGDGLYYADGYSYGYCYGVRPVVSLQSNINLEYNSTSAEWEFSE